MIRYSSPQSPAKNILELADYLLKKNKPNFLYRGQNKEYPGPLFPSAYRHKQLLGKVSFSENGNHRKSMRQVGQQFYEIKRFRNFDDIYLAYSGEPEIKDRAEVTLLEKITHDSDSTKLISEKGFDEAVKLILSQEEVTKYNHRFTTWRQVLNNQHKGLLRLNGANQFLGYRVGQTLAQQYIESSEHLDATRSPLIAAFFATFNATKSQKNNNELGIIYRFRNEQNAEEKHLEFDYYSAPPYIDGVSIITSLEIDSDEKEPQWEPSNFIYFYMLSDERYWEFLQMPRGSVYNTRIGRQQAAFIVADEIHCETRRFDGEQLVSYQAIEDIAERKGVEKFYFRHTETKLEDSSLTQERLWPSEQKAEQNIINLMKYIACAESILRIKHRGKHLVRYYDPELWFPERPELIYISPNDKR